MNKTILCGPSIYEYEGWLFEFSYMNGPWPLKKKCHSPKERAGKKFWNMWKRFDKLEQIEKDKFMFHKGGCIII